MTLTARLLIASLVALAAGLFFWLRYFRRRDEILQPEGVSKVEFERAGNLLPAIIIIGVLCRLVFVFCTPQFHGPDEYPHYKYIEYVATNHSFPVEQHMWGDTSYDWEYCQPPLYYLLVAPVYGTVNAVFHNMAATSYVLRMFSVLLWGANVWLALVLLRRLKIDDPMIKSFVLGFVCLLPTYTFISSVINNDNLLTVLGTVLLYLMASQTLSVRGSLATGAVLGFALLTKQSAVLFIPAIVALYCFQAASGRVKWSSALTHLAVVLACAFILFLPWALRNYHVYGSLTPEFLFVEKKTWPNPFLGILSSLHSVLKSFWAVSGPGNEVAYPFPLLGYILLFLCLNWREEPPEELDLAPAETATAGVAQPQRQEPKPDFLNRVANRPFYSACKIAILVNLLLVLRFGYVLGMGQGRHLFPVLLPIALLLAARWRTFPAKRLEPYTTGIWIAYALGFLLFSMWLLPIVPR